MQNKINKFIDRCGFQPTDILTVLAGCLLYYFTLFNSLPLRFSNFIQFFVKENTLILISIICYLGLTFLISGWLGRSIRWFGLVWLFGIFLRGYWLIDRTAFYQLYGILPWVDANELFVNAQRMIFGFPMDGLAAARPIFSTVFALLLTFTQSNMLYSIGILVFLVAISLFLFGEFIRKEYGIIPATLTIALTFMYYRNYLGAISTESLGLLVGLLGWIWLIKGVIHRRSLIEICLGFFLVAIAFNIRVGTLLVLPMIVIGIVVTTVGRRDKIRNFLIVSLSGVSGFLINFIVLKVFVAKDVVPFANYFYSLYGMAAGGKSWAYIFASHPEVINLSEPTKTQTIIRLTLNLINQDPTKLIKSMFDQYVWFFNISRNSVFSFIHTNVPSFNYIMQNNLYLFSIIAIIILIIRWKKNSNFLFLSILVGIVLSIPLVPPQHETFMRPYAVVIPILTLIPGFGIQWICNLLVGRYQFIAKIAGLVNKPLGNDDHKYSLYGYTISVLIFLIIMPFVFFIGRNQKQIPTPTCSINQEPFSWSYNKNNVVNINKDLIQKKINWISLSSAMKLKHGQDFESRTQFFDYIKSGITISPNVNLLNGGFAWVWVPTSYYESGNGTFVGCGKLIKDPAWYGFSIFKVQSSQKLANESIIP